MDPADVFFSLYPKPPCPATGGDRGRFSVSFLCERALGIKKTWNMKGLCATVVGVFRGFFKICSPAGQENFGFPALSFCRLGVFLPFPDFCSLFVPSTQMRNMGKREQSRKFLPKTPKLPLHSPEFLQNSLSEGEQNSRNSSKTPSLG